MIRAVLSAVPLVGICAVSVVSVAESVVALGVADSVPEESTAVRISVQAALSAAAVKADIAVVFIIRALEGSALLLAVAIAY